MNTKRKISIALGAFGRLFTLSAPCELSAQQTMAPADAGVSQAHHDSIAELPPEQHALFDALREAVQQGHDADVLADGKKLLLDLQANTSLADFVTQVTAGAAIETGDTNYALTLIKPFVDAHRKDWHAAALLVRIYAESGEKALRDQQSPSS
jgi:hypothetical protein